MDVNSGHPPRPRPWRIWLPLLARRHAWHGLLFPSLALIGMLVLLSPYLLTNSIASMRNVTVCEPKSLFPLLNGGYLDDAIPFVGWSLLVYQTNFLFYILLCFSTPRTNSGRRQLLVTVQFIVLASWFAFVVFLLLPTRVDLREQAFAAGATRGWLGPLYSSMHLLDPPYNAWPSLHVAQTFLAAIGMTHWCGGPGRTLRVSLLWILWAALVCSTLTTKQHFVWDALTGLVLGVSVWWFGLRPALAVTRGRQRAASVDGCDIAQPVV